MFLFNSLRKAYFPETDFPERHVDKEKCSKCGRCYETCPTHGYRWRKGDFPEPVGYGEFKAACLNCGNCIAVCPTDAITINGSYSVKSGRYQNYLLKKVSPPDPLGLKGKKQYKDFKENLSKVEQAIYSRRSNRLFKDKQVPKHLIERILEAGRFAPSAGNCQPYKFIVITDQQIIREYEMRSMKILKQYKDLYLDTEGNRPWWKRILVMAMITFSSWIMVNKVDPRPITAMHKAYKNNEKIHFNAPTVIMVLKDKRGISNPDLDAGICAQNMVLAAHSLGLGTCYISLSITPLNYPIMRSFRKKLGISYPYEAVTSIAIGYPKGKIDGIVKRDTPPVAWI
ncbi:MAG: 4Fe-4S binding protein [Desulfobacteraceae bacterium]|nr:nitroreductase family protein [Desulfobacteraceae bacterium]MBC2755877.1 4Fe-4S binding protein [Desulfobacteraceae bacterium]MBC2763956.1 4Fe-4S binding protein [ANME-2 cluster archaeon]